MARNKGMFTFAANFQVKAAEALDPRSIVTTKAELINKETWPYDGNTLYLYKGLQVVVAEELAIYVLADVSKALDADYSGWLRKDIAQSDVERWINTKVSSEVDTLNEKITAIEGKLTSIFTFKGSKATLAEIEAIESPAVGDVYHNTENAGEYVYTGNAWEFLGINIDLTAYAKTADVTSAIDTAKTELTASLDEAKTDLQGKLDQKVDKAEGKSLVADTLIDQISTNKADIAELDSRVETAEGKITTIEGNITSLQANLADLAVKGVDTTASKGVSLSLTEGNVGVSVNAADLAASVKPELGLKTNDIKLTAAIGGSVETPTYAADASLQEVLSGLDSRIKSNTDSISAAVAGGVTSITEGDCIKVDTSASTTSPKVSVKIAADGNIKKNSAGELDLVWIEDADINTVE